MALVSAIDNIEEAYRYNYGCEGDCSGNCFGDCTGSCADTCWGGDAIWGYAKEIVKVTARTV